LKKIISRFKWLQLNMVITSLVVGIIRNPKSWYEISGWIMETALHLIRQIHTMLNFHHFHSSCTILLLIINLFPSAVSCFDERIYRLVTQSFKLNLKLCNVPKDFYILNELIKFYKLITIPPKWNSIIRLNPIWIM
jgi:hypothetical protein